jgi:dihydroxyacetone kinase
VVASPASAACAVRIAAALDAMHDTLVAAEDELGRIDAIAGDGDHGRGMVKGIGAAAEAAHEAMADSPGANTILDAAGHAWEAKAGGTSGALWGTALRAIGTRLGDQSEEITPTDVCDAMRAAMTAIMILGGAKLGDKTMLDALGPFNDALAAEVAGGASLASAWLTAARAAEQAALDTSALSPKIGRARPLAARSIGNPDAGAVSLAMCLTVAAPAVAQP